MKSLFTFLIISCTYLFSFGQELNQVVKQDIFGNPSNAQNQMYINMLNHAEALKGAGETSLYTDWEPLEATGKDGITLTIDSANYNYSTDQFYFVHNEDQYFLDSKKAVNVEIGSDRFGMYTYKLGKDTKSGFLQILVDGDMPLLKHVYLKKVVTNDHPMKLPQAEKVEFKKTTTLYYLDKKSNVCNKLPKNKKKIMDLFKRRQSKLSRYAQEQKLSTTDEDDMVKFFQYNKMISEEQNQ